MIFSAFQRMGNVKGYVAELRHNKIDSKDEGARSVSFSRTYTHVKMFEITVGLSNHKCYNEILDA